MNNLLSDTWLYVSGVGLIFSVGLFPIISKKSKTSDLAKKSEEPPSTAELDITRDPFGEEEQATGAAIEPIKVIPKSETQASDSRTSSPATVVQAATVEAPPPAQATSASLANESFQSSAAAKKPALLLLENLKRQMDDFEKQMQLLRAQLLGFSQNHDKQLDALMARLENMSQQSVVSPKPSTAGSSKEASETSPEPKIEPKPQPKQEQLELKPQAKPEQTPEPKSEQKLTLDAKVKAAKTQSIKQPAVVLFLPVSQEAPKASPKNASVAAPAVIEESPKSSDKGVPAAVAEPSPVDDKTMRLTLSQPSEEKHASDPSSTISVSEQEEEEPSQEENPAPKGNPVWPV